LFGGLFPTIILMLFYVVRKIDIPVFKHGNSEPTGKHEDEFSKGGVVVVFGFVNGLKSLYWLERK